MSAVEYVVKIEFDPTDPRGMRWAAEIRDQSGRLVALKSCRFSRKSAERAALRHIRRLPGQRSYSFTVTRQEAKG